MRAQAVLLFIIYIFLSGSAFSEIYSYIDSDGRLTYTSNPSKLPEGQELKSNPAGRNEKSEAVDQQSISNHTIRVEQLNHRFEQAKIEIDSKLEKLSATPTDEYGQAIQDILRLKLEILDLNEKIIDLATKIQEESELRLRLLYAWSDKIDLLLNEKRVTNRPQERNPRSDKALSVEEEKPSKYSFDNNRKSNSQKRMSSPSSTNSW